MPPAPTAPDGASANIAQFKRFLAARPRIKTLVFSHASPFEGGPFRTICYHAACDGDNFFIRQIPSPDDYLKKNARILRFSPSFRGRYGGKCFYAENGLIVESPDADAPASGQPSEESDPTRRALPGLGLLEACLNLGFWDIYPNSFIWIDDSFTAARGRSSEIYDVRRQHQAHGAAEPGPEVRLAGVPETIHGQIEIAGGRVAKVSVVEFPLSVGYEYSDGLPLPAGLPSKFSIYAGEELAGVFQIYRLETSSGDIDDAHFAPEAQLEPGSHFRTVFTRNGVRVADPGEQLEWVKAMKADRTPDFDMSAPL